ncbi:hypothetical protein BH09VER1_BH09VER1_13310 [soil metagenome]
MVEFPPRISRRSSFRGVRFSAFTLVEMLVAIAILSLLMVVIASVMNHTSSTVHIVNSKLDAFQAARAGFDALSQKLSQATLNTYWDYDNPNAPTKFTRRSDLHFLTTGSNGSQSLFFQSPEAVSSTPAFDQTQGLLNACGFFVEFGSDKSLVANHWTRPAHVVTDRYRYRLMQSVQPTDDFAVFRTTDNSWTAGVAATAWPLADNVIALIVEPREELTSTNSVAPNYSYDSRTGTAIQKAQLPPIVQLTIVVIDEAAASRLNPPGTTSAPSAITNALAGKFSDVSKYSDDLQKLESALTAARIKYQVFTSSVMLRESKWSSSL